MSIVFLDEATVNLDNDISYDRINELGDLITYPTTATKEEAIERSRNAEHIIVNKVPVTEDLLTALDSIRHVAVLATGYNNIDIEACREAGIFVTNVPGYARYSVPQHIFALILNLATKVHLYDRDVRNGEWQRSDSFTLLRYPTFELVGKTIGIIGFGSIGKGVARIAEGFGMRVLVHRRSDRTEGGYTFVSLDRIYEESDIITLGIPLTESNKYMIDADVLARMKSTAILINTARGALVDQQALADALNAGVIGGAGIDVLDVEPPGDNPLLGDVKNLVITPHSAWSTTEARQTLVDVVAGNIKGIIDGKPVHVVCGP